MSKTPSHNDRAKAAEAKVSREVKSEETYQGDVQRQMFIDDTKRNRK